MFYKLWYTFARIFNRDRIPKLPRGMLAAAYEDRPGAERDVMRRLGCRDPRGVKLAMKRYGVKTIPELIDLLEHQKPKRNIRHRIGLMVARMVGGSPNDPHRAEIMRQERQRKRNPGSVDIKQRIQTAKEMLK